MKTNIGLVKHAEKALTEGWGYVWGTFGQTLSLTILNQKINQYPQGVGNYQSFIKRNWLNKRTVDCIGLMKSYLWWNNGNVSYTPSQDINANMAYNMAKRKGNIAAIPEVPGLCVWRRGHIGVYIGNGWVIEAQGTKYGVRKNKLKNRNFTHWLEHPHINYTNAAVTTKPLIRLGDRGSHVRELQSNLTSFGWNVGVIDGIAGNNTIKGIKAFQKAHGLSIDGVFGANSYAILDAAIEKGNDKPIKNAKSEYIEKGNVKIIKTKPDNIEVKVIGDNLHSANVYGINGALYDLNTAPVTSPESCVMIAMNDGKAISNNSQFNGWKSPPRATMIYHTSGKMGFRKLQNINPIRNITDWAVGGFMVKPYMDFENEKIPTGVNYKTAHTYIGYDDEGYMYLIVKPNHNIPEIVPTLNDLGITKAIVLDGGGSTQLRHPQGSMQANRKINTAIVLKEV